MGLLLSSGLLQGELLAERVDEQIGVVSRYVPSSMMAKRHIGSVTRARWPSFALPGTFETNLSSIFILPLDAVGGPEGAQASPRW
jgi:hypothetical protein